MASQRQLFVRKMYLVATALVLALGLLFAGILWIGYGADDRGPGFVSALGLGFVVYVTAGMLVAGFVISWTVRNILRPLGNTVVVASRVAQGDLSVTVSAMSASQADGLTESVATMLTELRTLVGAIRTSAQDAAAMAQEISASTEEMSASTQEVSGTCNDLTDRATRQAALVRGAAEDATRILEIAQQLAGSASQAAHRNAALAELARQHRDELAASSTELRILAEEIARGAEEAVALAAASEEIEQFVTETKAIARQTHMLALNAGIEAARAGEEGKGFAVVAEEVKKLAGQAAQAATLTSETVRAVQERVTIARERLLRLARGGDAARATASKAAEGLARVAEDAHHTDAWSRQISQSSGEVRSLIEGIAGKMQEVSGGTEDVAAAAEQIAASAQQLSASTEQVAGSALNLAQGAQGLLSQVGRFRVS